MSATGLKHWAMHQCKCHGFGIHVTSLFYQSPSYKIICVWKWEVPSIGSIEGDKMMRWFHKILPQLDNLNTVVIYVSRSLTNESKHHWGCCTEVLLSRNSCFWPTVPIRIQHWHPDGETFQWLELWWGSMSEIWSNVWTKSMQWKIAQECLMDNYHRINPLSLSRSVEGSITGSQVALTNVILFDVDPITALIQMSPKS